MKKKRKNLLGGLVVFFFCVAMLFSLQAQAVQADGYQSYRELSAELHILNEKNHELENIQAVVLESENLSKKCFGLASEWRNKFDLLISKHENWLVHFNNHVREFNASYKKPENYSMYDELEQRVERLKKNVKNDMSLNNESITYMQDVRGILKCFAELDGFLYLLNRFKNLEYFHGSDFFSSKDQFKQEVKRLESEISQSYDVVVGQVETRKNLGSNLHLKWDRALRQLAAHFNAKEIFKDGIHLQKMFHEKDFITDLESELWAEEWRIWLLEKSMHSPLTALRRERIRPFLIKRLKKKVADLTFSDTSLTSIQEIFKHQEEAHHASLEFLKSAERNSDKYHELRVKYVHRAKQKEDRNITHCNDLAEQVEQLEDLIASEEAFQRFVRSCV